MRVLSINPKLRYLQVVYDEEDVDAFRDRLIKSGSLAGLPIRLSDGRKVGVVLSGGAWPYEFEADGDRFVGAGVIELMFDSAAFMKHASEAELVLEEDAVALLGSGAGDHIEPVKKSGSDALRDELRAGWGLP